MGSYEAQRFVAMAEEYDRLAPYLVPCYVFLQTAMIDYLQIEKKENPLVVDLGAGSGILLERILGRNDGAHCYWVDSSEGFLDVARRRLARFGERVEFILSPIETDWWGKMRGRPNVIFSMSAIHHLTGAEKRMLYHRCFEELDEEGWFVNIDEMKSFGDDAYMNSLRNWVRHVEECGETIDGELRELYEKWKGHFDRWRERNIENFDRPKSKGDDMHESFVRQLEWLREVGYVDVDLYVKYHLWCIIGGRKPAGN